MTDKLKPHYPHFLESGLSVCGGTLFPTIARLVKPSLQYERPKVRVDIFAGIIDPHISMQGIDPLAQEILTVTDDEEVIRDFNPETTWPYIERALDRNKTWTKAAIGTGILIVQGKARPVEDLSLGELL